MNRLPHETELEAICRRISEMSNEELLSFMELPEGARETNRTAGSYFEQVEALARKYFQLYRAMLCSQRDWASVDSIAADAHKYPFLKEDDDAESWEDDVPLHPRGDDGRQSSREEVRQEDEERQKG